MHVWFLRALARAAAVAIVMSFACAAGDAQAQGPGWRVFSDASGTRVDVPAAIFSERAGAGDPPGQVFATPDRRATLHIFTVQNVRRESPRALLRRTYPSSPASLSYDRITDRFFAISKRGKGMIAYRRCNFVRAQVHCVELTYPIAEKRAWDAIVTRVSLSLRPR